MPLTSFALHPELRCGVGPVINKSTALALDMLTWCLLPITVPGSYKLVFLRRKEALLGYVCTGSTMKISDCLCHHRHCLQLLLWFSLPGSKIPTRSPSTVVGCIFQVEACNFMYAEDVTSLQYHKSDGKYYCPAAVLPAEALTACPAYRAVMLWPRQKKFLAFG